MIASFYADNRPYILILRVISLLKKWYHFFLADFPSRIGNSKKKSDISKKKMLSADPTLFVVLWNHNERSVEKKLIGKNFPEKKNSENSFVSIFIFGPSSNRVIWIFFCEIFEMQKNAKKSCIPSALCKCVLDFFAIFCRFFEKEGCTYVNLICLHEVKDAEW